MIFRAPMNTEGRRSLLVFVSGEEAAEFARGAGMEFLKPTPVASGSRVLGTSHSPVLAQLGEDRGCAEFHAGVTSMP
jgi:hypothetical protein